MIASGKSSYCKKAAKEGILCVNDDAIVNMLHAGNYTEYKSKLKPLYKSIENHIVGCALMLGKTIIIDRGVNISRRARARFINIAKSFDAKVEAIIFPKESPEIHAKRRFEKDSHGISYERWLNCAKAHNTAWVNPTLLEGFDAIHYTDFNSDNVIL